MAPAPVAERRNYGVADLIRLLKTLPTDHHPKLVLQVIRTTLESVGVESSAVIEDAVVVEKAIRDQIAALESQIVDLTREIAARRDRIGYLQAELAETIDARDRLADEEPSEIEIADFEEERSEGDGALASQIAPRLKPGSLPPPVPPPLRKPASGGLPVRVR
jgi:hypothetical protein